VRRKGQLSFPFAHATLVGVSLSLLLITTGLGSFIFQKEEPISSDLSPSILEDKSEFVTEESILLSTKAKVHEVRENETIHAIAEQYWTTVDTLAAANNLRDTKGNYVIQPGDKLNIPPIKGETYTVRPGDTVKSVALMYSANAQSIVEFNYLFSPYTLAVGSELIIPVYYTGSQLVSAETPTGTCGELSLAYPTKGYNNLGGFTYSHRAIDFAANLGEALFAGADGEVVAAGDGFGPCFSYGEKCNHGYGGYVFINIGGGYQIRYGHISKASVGVSEKISKGEEVAKAGQSGVAYSPHLHFELLCNGQKINPYPYFPK
jgi:murein DD-endopeptidase MepM/ murein hydrolase activator NlpD